MFEIVIESGFGHWRGSFDDVVVDRLHRLIGAREFAIERRGKLVVHRQIVIERRDVFERTGDRLAEIIVEGRFELRLRFDLELRIGLRLGGRLRRGAEVMVRDIV
ncbi:hypothetical protein, partial [Mesorhizobium sp. M4B.F.Ca.ET.049.02.1.2]